MNFSEIPYQHAARFLVIDGLRIAYTDSNPSGLITLDDEPAPVVFVHGVAATLDWFADVSTRVAAARRSVAIDLIGFGKSDKPQLDDAIPFYVELLEKIFKELGVDRVTLVGHSMGGMVAALFALERPQMVDRLVLVAPAGVRPVPPEHRAEILDHWSRARLTSMDEAEWRGWFAAMVHKWTDEMEDVWRLQCELAKGVRFREWAAAAESAVESVLRHPIGERFRDIAAPTLVVWGAEDRAVPYEHAEELAAMIPGARLATIGSCGHYPMLERPEAFAQEVTRFAAPGAAVAGAASTTRVVQDVKPWPGMAPEIGRLARSLFDVRMQCAKGASALSIDELAWKPSAGANSAGALLLHLAGAAAWYYHEMLLGERMPRDVAARLHVDPDNPNAPLTAPRQSAGQLLAEVERVHEQIARWLEGRGDEQLDRTFTHSEKGSVATLRWILWHLLEDALHHRGQIAYIRRLLSDRRAGS